MAIGYLRFEWSATLGASTFTVFKEFKQLIDEKQIFGEQGNGYFWGQKKTHLPIIRPKESVEERIERLFVADWKSGKISADNDLPSIKDMAQTYECSYDSMRRMLEKKAFNGSPSYRRIIPASGPTTV